MPNVYFPCSTCGNIQVSCFHSGRFAERQSPAEKYSEDQSHNEHDADKEFAYEIGFLPTCAYGESKIAMSIKKQ